MKTLNDMLHEALLDESCHKKTWTEEEEGEIDNEKDFRNWAESKFSEVFGDDLDENKMKETIDGFLKDNKDLVENGEWGKLVGMMNKSFAK